MNKIHQSPKGNCFLLLKNDKEQLNEREIYWIRETRAIEIGYNISTGGTGGNLGEEVNKKISKTLKEKFSNGEYKNPRKSKRIELICPICKKTFITTEDTRKRKYCSRSCADKLHSIFMSKEILGEKNPMYGKSGADNPNYGSKRLKETKDILSKIRKGKTWEEIFGEEKATKMKLERSERWKGDNNPKRKKRYDSEYIVDKIREGW